MSRRRDLLIGGACAAAGVAGYGLTPRRRISLLGADRLEDIAPRRFGDWTSADMDDEVAPKEEGSLASRLYGQSVGRLYTNARTGVQVMLLLAWGDTQSNALQLHRPEVCYPAFGFEIVASEAVRLPLSATAALPARSLTVRRGDRIEQVLYWTRLGEYLPQTVQEQRVDRIRAAMAGSVPDGVLVRLNRTVSSTAAPVASLRDFAPELLAAIPAARRKVLLGTALARAI